MTSFKFKGSKCEKKIIEKKRRSRKKKTKDEQVKRQRDYEIQRHSKCTKKRTFFFIVLTMNFCRLHKELSASSLS